MRRDEIPAAVPCFLKPFIKIRIMDKPLCVCWEQIADEGGRGRMAEKEAVSYTVEREFLAKFSVEELIARIVKSHMNSTAQKDGNP